MKSSRYRYKDYFHIEPNLVDRRARDNTLDKPILTVGHGSLLSAMAASRYDSTYAFVVID